MSAPSSHECAQRLKAPPPPRQVMRGGVVALMLASSLLLLAPSAAAQGPPLSTEHNTIWNQYTTEGGCCTTFGSTLNEDPRFQGSGNFGTLLLLPAATSTSFRLDYALTPEEFAYPVFLDPDGTVDFTVNLGGGLSTGGAVGVASVDVDVELTVGDTVIASGSGESIIDTAADGYKTVTYSVAPSQTTLDPADGPIQWSIVLTGAANGVYVSHTDANGNGWAALPIIGGGPVQTTGVIYEDLDAPELEHVFENATSDTYVLNFTNGFENATVSLAWNGTGSVDVALHGPDGVRFTEALEGEGAVEQAFTGVPTGAWNLTLAYQDFVGDLRFLLTETVGDDETPADETDEADQGGEVAGNETLQGGAAGEESPALPVALLLGAVMAVAARRRR